MALAIKVPMFCQCGLTWDHLGACLPKRRSILAGFVWGMPGVRVEPFLLPLSFSILPPVRQAEVDRCAAAFAK